MKKKIISLILILTFLCTVWIPSAAENSAVENNSDVYHAQDSLSEYHSNFKNIPSAIDAVELTEQQSDGIFGLNSGLKEPTSQLNEGGNDLNFYFSLHQPTQYEIVLRYASVAGNNNDMKIGIKTDGIYPCSAFQNIIIRRLWVNEGGVRKLDNGNQIAPKQKELLTLSDVRLADSTGMTEETLKVQFESGNHSVTLVPVSGSILIQSVKLTPILQTLNYDDALKKYKDSGAKEITGDVAVIEGENATIKNAKSILPKCDNSECSLSPCNSTLDVMNYIGSTNWQNIGDEISWTVYVPQSGLYKMGFHFRQSYILGGYSYRKLRIDGEVPFEEATHLAFPYHSKWKYNIIKQDDGTPFYFYLTEGKHILSLSVTMGQLSEVNRTLTEQVLKIGTIYRKIVMITGETPDINRDYNLFGQIPNLKKDLTDIRKMLNASADQISKITKTKSNSQISVIRNMSNTIGRILSHPYQASDYKNDYYSNYGSLGSTIYEMRKLPLDIDNIQLIPFGSEINKTRNGFMDKVDFSCKRFIASFVNDYSSVSGNDGKNEDLTIWLNWGRDQVQVLSDLIHESFTPQTHINVKVKIVNATLIQAMLSQKSPDLSLRLSRAAPLDYAMRGALYDLRNYKDFDEVVARFMPNASLPYEFQSGCYALPDTQTFFMTFYRKDILSEIGLGVPTTWNKFIEVASILAQKNMQVGIPYTQIDTITTVNSGIGSLNLFATVLQQFGGKLYTKDYTASTLTSPIAVEAFKYWTEFYTKYSMPVTYNFYNRFRSGEMPLAIQPYNQYATLAAAATEINGLWGMAPIPGFEMKDGTINNCETGGGTGSVILKKSRHKEEAWEFLKWWTSAQIQARYTDEIESVLGTVERQPTANIEALEQMSWDSNDKEMLLKQWKNVNELPEIPGGYYVPRCIEQAYWNVINKGVDAKSTIIEWGKSADLEIKRKRAEYDLTE